MNRENIKNEVAEQIRSIRECEENTQEKVRLIETLCTHVNLQKYSERPEENENTYPFCMAPVEEHLLYSEEQNRERLSNIVFAIRTELPEEYLYYIHKLLANALVSSNTFEYTQEYDRWLVLSVIKIIEIKKTEKYVLEYFSAVVNRLNTNREKFTDRGIILSDFLTDSQLLYDSPETPYFYTDIKSKPVVEEVNESPEEELERVQRISTLAEYYSIIKAPAFLNEHPDTVEHVVNQLQEIIRTENLKNIKKYYLEIIKIHLSIRTPSAHRGISDLLVIDNIAYSIFTVIYNRDTYSLEHRRILVSCLQEIIEKLRKDILSLIVTMYGAGPHSEEEKKLGLHYLFHRIFQLLKIY